MCPLVEQYLYVTKSLQAFLALSTPCSQPSFNIAARSTWRKSAMRGRRWYKSSLRPRRHRPCWRLPALGACGYGCTIRPRLRSSCTRHDWTGTAAQIFPVSPTRGHAQELDGLCGLVRSGLKQNPAMCSNPSATGGLISSCYRGAATVFEPYYKRMEAGTLEVPKGGTPSGRGVVIQLDGIALPSVRFRKRYTLK